MKHKYRVILYISLGLLILPWVLPNRYFLSVALFTGINTIIVIGLNLLVGYTGQISLGHAAFYGLGAYAAAVLTTRFGWNSFLGLIAAVLIVILVAWIIGKPTLKLKGHYLAMATLGFGLIFQIVMEEMGELTGGPQGMSNIPKLSVFGFRFAHDIQLYFLIWGLIIILQIMVMNLVNGKFGRALKAIHSNEIAAEAMGVDTARLKLFVFVISAAFAGLAGGIYAYYINYISPEPFGFGFSIFLVTVVIIGGMGDLWGPVLGAVFLSILPEILRGVKDYDILIYGLMLMLIIIFMPRGIIAIVDRFTGLLNKLIVKKVDQ